MELKIPPFGVEFYFGKNILTGFPHSVFARRVPACGCDEAIYYSMPVEDHATGMSLKEDGNWKMEVRSGGKNATCTRHRNSDPPSIFYNPPSGTNDIPVVGPPASAFLFPLTRNDMDLHFFAEVLFYRKHNKSITIEA